MQQSVGYSDSVRAGRSGDRFPALVRFSTPVHTGPGAHPVSCTMGIESFPRVKRPGHDVDHPPPSSAEVKGRVELYLYSPSGPSWPVMGWTVPLPFFVFYRMLSNKTTTSLSKRIVRHQSLKQEHKLKVVENRMLRRTEGSRKWWRKFRDWYSCCSSGILKQAYCNKAGNVHKTTLRRVRVTVVAAEEQGVLLILSACL
jgi:hypothetical protein